jgi:hypothetical protein
MVDLDNYVMIGNYEKFKKELLKGITERPAYCVEIFERAFGKDYHISPILSNQLSKMYEAAINELVKEGKIKESIKFKDIDGKDSIFSTSYVRAQK